jgi:5-methyltetrahydrofolate--homocysteine methyltransferase
LGARIPFIDALKERVLVCDGAMGTQIQAADLSLDDFDGLDGCNEILCLTRPDVIEDIHRKYFDAGADIVETNTFGAISYVLDEYEIRDKLSPICRRAAEIARKVADEYDTDKYVFGAIGPGTKLATLGQVSFDEVEDSYGQAFSALIEGGSDALLIETAQDLLNVKAAVAGAISAMRSTGKQLPLFVQVTVELTGTLLVGSEIAAAVTQLEMYPEVTGIGINCATGPEEMQQHVRYLSQHSTRKISVLPNAGLPMMENGQAVYKLTPEVLADYHERFVSEHGVDIVGGCCGTTPEHVSVLAERIKGVTRAERKPEELVGCASLYAHQPYDQSPSFLIVGERTNANGSRLFRDLLAAEDWTALTELAREQEAEGSHVLDVCTAYVGRDEVADMNRLLFEYAQQVTIPVMVDSTEANVIEDALKRLPGKPIVNSINYEDGGTRTKRVLAACKKYGAAIVGLTIDEDGMAKTAAKKVEIAERILEETREHGIADHDVFIDFLTFTLGSGDEEFRRAGIETIDAIRELKKRHPDVNTLLGVSNISFGLKPASRHVLNSVFLHYCREAGLTSAIVQASKIMPESQVDPKLWEIARKIVFDERDGEYDPLVDFMSQFESVSSVRPTEDTLSTLSIEDRLKRHIVDGIKKNLEVNLDVALQTYKPLDIINNILLDGMKEVGELFGAGKMQLPFVLQSAEVMKTAVRHLEPLMEKVEGDDKGSILLATVAGDVHDIGKNLVDIILSNNGFRVVNIGIKQPISNIIAEADANKVDAIGLSGLLVKSTLVMKDNLVELNERGLHEYPVILGGAALTRAYVEQDLRSIYKGNLWYAQDAFEGLRIMQNLDEAPVTSEESEEETGYQRVTSHRLPDSSPELYVFDGVKSDVVTDNPIPRPPFVGRRVMADIDIWSVYPFINEIALFRGQWGFRRPKDQDNIEFNEYLKEHASPTFERLKAMLKDAFAPKVVYGFFPAQSEGNDLIIYQDDGRTERTRFRFPRQSVDRRLCLADFFAATDSGRMDYAAFQLVTVGPEVSRLERELFAKGDYQDYLYVHGMGVETAEALAEWFHKQLRCEWGIAHEDAPEIKLLFSTKYRGCRYSFGYPACPNLEDQAQLFELLAPNEIGVELTEEFMLVPEQSTSAIVCHHPEAKYFNIR